MQWRFEFKMLFLHEQKYVWLLWSSRIWIRISVLDILFIYYTYINNSPYWFLFRFLAGEVIDGITNHEAVYTAYQPSALLSVPHVARLVTNYKSLISYVIFRTMNAFLLCSWCCCAVILIDLRAVGHEETLPKFRSWQR